MRKLIAIWLRPRSDNEALAIMFGIGFVSVVVRFTLGPWPALAVLGAWFPPGVVEFIDKRRRAQ